MKVSIIGGGGLVGSMTAYALQCGGVVSHLCLIDANKDMAQGQALDLLHGAGLVARPAHHGRRHEDVATSNIVVITAGLRRKPDESRLDLINRNVDLFLGLLEQVKTAGLKDERLPGRRQQPGGRADLPGGAALAVCPGSACIGLGTQLDTARFRGYLARRLQVPADAGAGPDPRRTRRQHGADLVERHRGRACRWNSGRASVRRCRRKFSRRRRLPGRRSSSSRAAPASPSACRSAKWSTPWRWTAAGSCRSARFSTGLYGIRDVCLSVPTVVGCGGVRQQIELPLTPKETLGIQQSARVLRETIDQVESRIGKVSDGNARLPQRQAGNRPRRTE